MEIADPVRRLAVRPWHELPTPPDVEVLAFDGAVAGFNKWPNAQMVRIDGDGPADVAATVETTRVAARERGKTVLAWWVTGDDDHIAPQLEACGLVNKDTPGFESVENALVLVEPPPGEPDARIEVRMTETWEDFRAGATVVKEAFGMPDVAEADLRARYEDYRRNPHGHGFVAFLDGRPVGNGFAVFADAGVNLFGGAVLEHARGHGVYRALVAARWARAVERGTPALTVQAGRMSRPILERLGFQFLEPVRVFVDEFAA